MFLKLYKLYILEQTKNYKIEILSVFFLLLTINSKTETAIYQKKQNFGLLKKFEEMNDIAIFLIFTLI